MDRADLSPREAEVLGLISQGLRVSDVASRLVVSEDTVKAHLKSIYRKKGVHSRVQLLLSLAGSAPHGDATAPSHPEPRNRMNALPRLLAPALVLILIGLLAVDPLGGALTAPPVVARMGTDDWTLADVDERSMERRRGEPGATEQYECQLVGGDSADEPHFVCE